LVPFPPDGIDIYYSEKDGAAVQHWSAVPPLSIKTDKVTTSEVAKNASAEDAVANDPNVTRFLSSDNKDDLITVLGTFK